MTTIEAVIIVGEENEAYELAVKANVSHGRNLTREECRKAVIELHRRYPEAGQSDLARLVSMKKGFVRTCLGANEVREKVSRDTPVDLPHSVLWEIHTAPETRWEALAL